MYELETAVFIIGMVVIVAIAAHYGRMKGKLWKKGDGDGKDNRGNDT